jgi:hypothetical protein
VRLRAYLYQIAQNQGFSNGWKARIAAMLGNYNESRPLQGLCGEGWFVSCSSSRSGI